MKKRQNYFRLHRRGLITTEFYNSYRNFVTSRIRKSKLFYYSDLFSKHKSDSKRTWNILNGLIKSQNSNSSEVEKIVVNNSSICNKSEISEIFNTHFSTIGERITDSMQNIHRGHLRYLSNVSMSNSFFLRPITIQNVLDSIDGLKSKSCSIEMYPVKILKILKEKIAPIFTQILNRSICDGYFPNFLKIARVIPLFKSGKKEDINNYRPISILHPFSKIFEKIIYDQ